MKHSMMLQAMLSLGKVFFENLKRYCIQYNMNSILMIPQDVDYKNPATVSKARVFFNTIDDWKKLEDEDYLQWQEFVLLHGSSVEVKSDNWLEEALLLSMETTLRSKVESDMKRYGASQCGPLNNALNPTLGLKASFIALIFRYIPLHTIGTNHFYKGGNQKRVPF